MSYFLREKLCYRGMLAHLGREFIGSSDTLFCLSCFCSLLFPFPLHFPEGKNIYEKTYAARCIVSSSLQTTTATLAITTATPKKNTTNIYSYYCYLLLSLPPPPLATPTNHFPNQQQRGREIRRHLPDERCRQQRGGLPLCPARHL